MRSDGRVTESIVSPVACYGFRNVWQDPARPGQCSPWDGTGARRGSNHEKPRLAFLLGTTLLPGGASSATVTWTVSGLAPISTQTVTVTGTVSGTFEFDATTGQFGTVALTSEGVTATFAGTTTTRQFGGEFASVTSASGALQFSAITTTG